MEIHVYVPKEGDENGRLFLVGVAEERGLLGLLNHIPQVLIHGESDGLAGSDTHNSGGDALVESVETFLPGLREKKKTVSTWSKQAGDWAIGCNFRFLIKRGRAGWRGEAWGYTNLNISAEMAVILCQALTPG